MSWEFHSRYHCSHRFVGMYRYDDAVQCPAGNSSIVIGDLENHVMKTGAIVGITDVHAGSFSHCVKTL
jgi:hypothetical protein